MLCRICDFSFALCLILRIEWSIELISLFNHLLYEFTTYKNESESKSVDHPIFIIINADVIISGILVLFENSN